MRVGEVLGESLGHGLEAVVAKDGERLAETGLLGYLAEGGEVFHDGHAHLAQDV